MWASLAIYFFVSAMVLVTIGYVVWRLKYKKKGSTASVELPAEVKNLNINALVQRKTMFLLTELPPQIINELFNGWDTFLGKPIIVCQQEAVGTALEQWEPTIYEVSEDFASRTPEQLGKITGWKQVVGLFARKKGMLETINQMLMVGIFIGLLLVGYLYYSSSTGT